MNLSSSELTTRLVAIVRKEAARQNVKTGSIAICYEAKSIPACLWLDLPEVHATITHTFPITPGENTILHGANGEEIGDSAGVAVAKIAAARAAIRSARAKNGEGELTLKQFTSEALPKELFGVGRICQKGAIGIPLYWMVTSIEVIDEHESMILYVAVSSEKAEKDEAIAEAAVAALEEVLDAEFGWCLPKLFRSDK